MRVDDSPLGEEAQVDFGEMGRLVDEAGRRRKLYVLVVTLTCSRYQYIWPTWHQTLQEVCAGQDAAWLFFGGVVKRMVPENAASMVLRAHSTSPELNLSFREYADSRGFFVDPARVQSPKDKPRVENQVPVCSRALVCWRDASRGPGGHPPSRRAQVPLRRWRARAWDDAQGASAGVRDPGKAAHAPATESSLQRAGVDESQGAPRPSAASSTGAVLGAGARHWSHGEGARRQADRQSVSGGGAAQGASA